MAELTQLKLQTLLTSDRSPAALFSALMPLLCEELQCDRCFLYLRNPQTRMGKVPFCHVRNPQAPHLTDPDWKPEPEGLPEEDPMFAAALRTAASIFVEDVETAGPDILNRDFERENFGHRALIHCHLCQDGQLWGVLQPSVFGQSRVWTERDRTLIAHVETRIAPLAVAYVKSATV